MMIKRILTVLLLTFGFGSFWVQSISAQDSNEPVWQLRYFSHEEFMLEVPFGFETGGFKKDDEARSYSGKADGIYLYAFSDSIKKKSQFKMVSDFVSASTKTQVSFANNPCEYSKFEFLDRFGYYNRVLFIRTETRLYTFQTVSRVKNNKIAIMFLASIGFGTEKPKSPISLEDYLSETSDSPDIDLVNNSRIISAKTASNSTNSNAEKEIGIGSGNGGTSNSSSPKPISDSVGLKILEKPKARYTDLARFYGITGSVTLRLTFRSDGSLGNVSAASTLPFGLTETAIEAANRVTFEPAKMAGIPQTVTKTFMYGFSLY